MKRAFLEVAGFTAVLAILWPLAGRLKLTDPSPPDRFPREMWNHPTIIAYPPPARWDWVYGGRFDPRTPETPQ